MGVTNVLMPSHAKIAFQVFIRMDMIVSLAFMVVLNVEVKMFAKYVLLV